MTGYLGHSWQLYFTHPCWVDGATALVLKSERENRSITGSAPPCGSCASTACRNARSTKCRRRCPTYGSQINVTADRRYVCALLMERGVAGVARSAELFELRPRSQLVRIDVAGGGSEVLHEDRRYITHVNTSPTRSDLLTFCHEGLGRGSSNASGDSTWTPGRCGRPGPSAGSIR